MQGQASISFSVECNVTQPGQAVFVIGDHEDLGRWDPQGALPLFTDGDAFPLWSSKPISARSGASLEYKFIVQQENGCGPVTWEDIVGNRSVRAGEMAAPRSDAGPMEMVCAAVTAKSVWGDLDKSTVTAYVSEASQLPCRRAEQDMHEKEQTFLKMAESGAGRARANSLEASQLAKTFAGRESLRRNFSQSLMNLDASEEEEGDSGSEAQSFNVIQTLEGDGGGTPVMPLTRGIPIHNIMSFSALTEVLPPEEKAKARGVRKAVRQYTSFNPTVPVVIVSSEISPYSKSGGLGLVAASYSYEFARNGHPTMAIAPKYRHYEGLTYIGQHNVMVNEHEETVKYWHKYADYGDGTGTDYIFVDHPAIEREGGLYNGADGREYTDNLFRFTLLSLAALEAPLVLEPGGRKYGQKVLFMANDWQAGLVPLYLAYKYRPNGCYHEARAIYIVHNLGYQGQYPHVDACKFFCINHQAAGDLAFGDCINLSKCALICADRVLTVSPNYANEIQSVEGGFGLHDFVRTKACTMRLAGILNGIDDCWDPSSDKDIVQNFSQDDFESGKHANKRALQQQLGLHQDPNVVLIGFVGRLTWQKGVDTLAEIIGWLMHDEGNGVTGRAQLIMMGHGEPHEANMLRTAEHNNKGRVCGYVGFDPKVEHQMMAACDLFLMPSRYEPCGLPQMCAQLYGTLPIVHATGGLVDSVQDTHSGMETATGFHIWPLSADKMKETLYRAMELFFRQPGEFRRMQCTAMSSDYYWPKAMDMYEQQIDFTLNDPPIMR